FFFQAEDGIRDRTVTGVQTCALPIFTAGARNTRGVTEITISTWRLFLVGELNSRPIIGNPPSTGNPWRPVDCTSCETLASIIVRSEERRVGKEGRGGWAAADWKKK